MKADQFFHAVGLHVPLVLYEARTVYTIVAALIVTLGTLTSTSDFSI